MTLPLARSSSHLHRHTADVLLDLFAFLSFILNKLHLLKQWQFDSDIWVVYNGTGHKVCIKSKNEKNFQRKSGVYIEHLRRHIFRKFTCVTVLFHGLLSHWKNTLIASLLCSHTLLAQYWLLCVFVSPSHIFTGYRGFGVEVQKHGDPLSVWRGDTLTRSDT